MLRASISISVAFLFSSAASASRRSSFMRQPSSAFSFAWISSARASLSFLSFSRREIPASMPDCISAMRLCRSSISDSRRFLLSMLFCTFVRSTAASEAHCAHSLSAAASLSRALSLSMSLRRILSLMLSDEEYSASSSPLAFSSALCACSYSAFTASACA